MNKRELIFPVGCAIVSVIMSVAPYLESEPMPAVRITQDILSVTVMHDGKEITVARDQNPNHRIEAAFAKTSRRCPPFCIQPMQAAPGVETIGEVELVTFMKDKMATGEGLLIDARTRDWHKRGSIPGSVNIPYTDIAPSLGTKDAVIQKTMERFGAFLKPDGHWDFSQAKELVIWCNGPWCGQSPAAIRGLLESGYPARKIFYYRGGMQLWKLFGFTVIPRQEP